MHLLRGIIQSVSKLIRNFFIVYFSTFERNISFSKHSEKITFELKFNLKLTKLMFSYVLIFYLKKKIDGKKACIYVL